MSLARNDEDRTVPGMQTFSPADIDSITTLAFEHAAGTLLEPRDEQGSPTRCAFVDVTGPWGCRVTVCLDEELARVVAQRMWDADDVSDDDMDDAVKEMANVIGGAVKGMTPVEGCGLTIPALTSTPELDGVVRHYRVGQLAATVAARVLEPRG